MKNTSSIKLIDELLDNPSEFYNQGKSYLLLQEYFKGLSLETLRPLFSHIDVFVRRVAIWITSELGINGDYLIDDAIALLKDDDIGIKHDALEVIAVCSVGEHVEKFVNIVMFFENENETLCNLAMLLVSNATHFQLEGCVRFFGNKTSYNEFHCYGLTKLLEIHDGLTNLREMDAVKQAEFFCNSDEQIKSMLCSCEPLLRRYGIVIAKKKFVLCNNSIIPILNKIVN